MSKTENRKFLCELTEDELVERGDELAKEINGILQLEMQRAAVNAKIKPKKERVEELATVIEEKREYRQVDCRWEYFWDLGVKRLYRLDTFEEVDNDIIAEYERQQHLNLTGEETPGGYVEDDDRLTETDEKARMPFTSPVEQTGPAFTCDICQDLGQFRNAEGIVWFCGCDFGKSEASEALGEVSGQVPEHLIKLPAVQADETAVADAAACASNSTGGETQAELALTDEPQIPHEAEGTIDKTRNCCMPYDRTHIVLDGIRYLYCTKCLLIHRKEDVATGKELVFKIGRKVVLPGATTGPSPKAA